MPKESKKTLLTDLHIRAEFLGIVEPQRLSNREINFQIRSMLGTKTFMSFIMGESGQLRAWNRFKKAKRRENSRVPKHDIDRELREILSRTVDV